MMNHAAALTFLCLMLTCATAARLPFHSPVFQDKNKLSPVAKYEGPAGYEGRKDWVQFKRMGPRISKPTIGTILDMECEANGSPPPNVQWFQNGSPVTQGLEESNKVGLLKLGNMKARLYIDCVAPTHEGTYTCVAVSGTKIAVSKPSQVIVQVNESDSLPVCSPGSVPPHILTWSTIILDTIGNDVLLPCLNSGYPKPKVYWTNGNNNFTSPRLSKNQDERFKVMDSGNLMISDVRWADMGMYRCVAENDSGHETTETFLYPMAKDC